MTLRCASCGQRLPPGSHRYRLTVEMAADYDGVFSEDSARAADDLIERALAAVEARDPTELEREIYERQNYVLCPACRERYMADPLKAVRED